MKKSLTASLFMATFAIAVVASSCKENGYQTKQVTDPNGYTYSVVNNDPNQTRIYTLKNGLTVYLSVNKDEPRIMSLIATRAGSMNDPVETTGLAHYFEHMMFKGTDEIGTSNWNEEKVLLDSLAVLFNQHKATTDPAEKKKIYKEIDRISHHASKYAIANEYDKICSAIGAKGTNAFTSYDVTAYINNIPSNELKKWIEMETERFKDPVLRLFHTELETVYEEFNMYQDMDEVKLNNSLMSGLFPTHPLGRDVIGYPEHLKNPSMTNIMDFYHTWYVPNNMAIILSGDIDFDATIQLIDQSFGQLPSKELPPISRPKEEPIPAPVIKEVYGPEAEQLQIAYRFNGYNSDDRKYITLINNILSNATAGLIDLDLNQQQKVLRAESSTYFTSDYGIQFFMGVPRQGQTLEEVRDLLLGEIEKIKSGNFDDWMIQATVNNLKLQKIRQDEGAGRVYGLLNQFINQSDMAKELSFFDELGKITKEQLVTFAKNNFTNNYVIVYKRVGEAKNLVKVEKPEITPVEIDRLSQSKFLADFVQEEVPAIEPVFIDFKTAIKEENMNENVQFNYLPNSTNSIFMIDYITEMGSNHDPKVALAIKYLPYLGTDKYTPEQFKKELYKLGVSLYADAENDRSYVYVTGLDENCTAAIELMELILANAKPDKEAYDKMVEGLLKERADKKQSQDAIQEALMAYGQYGTTSPFTNIIPEEELRKIDPQELTDILHRFTQYPHRVFYYGPKEESAILSVVKEKHTLPAQFLAIPEEKKFTEQPTDGNKIYFINYDKSQVDIFMLSKCEPFSPAILTDARLFNEYYGGSMASVVFQEIREARALAYSAYAVYNRPAKSTESFYILGGVFTQADKMNDALQAMNGILGKMIVNENSFNLARESVIKSIQSERIIKSNIFWTWLRNKKLGIDYDIRKEYYEKAQNATIQDAQSFFDQHFANRKYSYLLVGNKNSLNFNHLKPYGNVEELTLEQIFNY